ncbi:MAG TPA: peptidylprolyl isomerase [Casimicrobiaceae bacterium]|jgi:peptidyl-prolyl cis-trans isomerase C|nr:peptidylprolyl isomerase [Casimicrobiaceae bacterium]
MTRTTIALAVMAALALPAAWAQAPAAPKAAPAPATKAAEGKALYPQAQFDLMLKERTSQGQPDSPELRASLREELNTRELLAREARKKGLEKQTDIKTQMDLSSQTVLVRAYVADWLKANPVPEADLKREYDAIKQQIGDKEYKVAHILVEKEDEAKEVVAELQKGAKFPDVAKARSKDPGSKDRGGDLDWNAPANFVKPFSDAMVKAEKGKFTPQPVQTQFGWHVLLVEDVRDAKVPGYDEVKPQLSQRMQAQHLDRYFRDLRAKNGL